jgi:hypothetical protein
MPSAELKLTATRDEAIDAIVAALPKESIVRDEDDGVGRFAGERVLLIVGHAKERLLLFRGSWGTLKARLDKPQLEVAFGRRDDTVTATLTQEPPQPPTLGSHVTNLASQMITIGAVVVAYHMFQSIPVDYSKVAIIAAVGSVAWSLIGHFVPKKPDRGLEGLVRDALAPMVAKKKKEAEEAPAEAADESPADPPASPPTG